jgi:thiol-disulfide isomerase/thioredoxin
MSASISRGLAAAVLVAGVGAIVWVAVDDDVEPTVAQVRAEQAASPTPEATPLEPIPVLGEADTLTGLDGWLNTEATSLEEIRSSNKLTVVQFWTFGCFNCKNTIPALQDIYAEFGDDIEIVGVHAPEFDYEADVDRIVEAAADLGVTWPIALDTNKRNFHRWQEGPTAWWPTVYLIDGDNQVRMQQRGDSTRHYVRLADYIERLLDGEA